MASRGQLRDAGDPNKKTPRLIRRMPGEEFPGLRLNDRKHPIVDQAELGGGGDHGADSLEMTV